MNAGDTVVAISTPPGRGGIGIVRLSGPAALDIALRLFVGKASGAEAAGDPDLYSHQFRPNHSVVGHVLDAESRTTIDTAVLTYFKAPRSYTGEDVVELSCHGSPVVLGLVLDKALSLGARLAEPGEFTMRAFLNRRIDLAQAQAVRDLIESQTAYQARLATRQLDGALSGRITPFKEALVEVIVHLESSLEFVEDDISPEATSALIDKLNSIDYGLAEIASSFAIGRYVKQGFDLAIVGRPNVGKSSIFNRLIGADRAIVTEIPGTTRDALHESTSIRGIPVRLIDTAGIRETTDPVESIGITRTRQAIADADIQLLVLDASEPLTMDDTNLISQTSELSTIVLLNKTDLPQRLDESRLAAGQRDEDALPGNHALTSSAQTFVSSDQKFGVPPSDGFYITGDQQSITAEHPVTTDVHSIADEIIKISALTGAGFDTLAARILDRLGGGESALRDDIMITDARQHQALRNALAALAEARELMASGELEEIVLLKLRASLQSIGEITGETTGDDILSQIFSTFCIGK